MTVRFPRPLSPTARIGVTSPSSGVGPDHRGRLDFAVRWLEARGYKVEVGSCMDGTTHTSAPVLERAAELMRMLLDPGIEVVIPPWGGETAIDLLPHLDFEALRRAEPTWVVGYSDISTLLVPLTLLSGWATIHGPNLMDTPFDLPDSLASWIDIATSPGGTVVRQFSPGVHHSGEWEDWTSDPTLTSHIWNGSGTWRRLDDGTTPIDVSGRLIGGCIETVAPLAGTRFGDTGRLRGAAGSDTTLVYLEASEENAFLICRALHGMRLAGFFDGAAAVLIGRTSAPNAPTLTQDEAVLDALSSLGLPILADVECGHVPPLMSIVNGCPARLVHGSGSSHLDQALGSWSWSWSRDGAVNHAG